MGTNELRKIPYTRQVRSMFRISWKDKVSNEDLCMRAHSGPISLIVRRYRWKLMRRPEDISANQATRENIIPTNNKKYHGNKPTNLPTVTQNYPSQFLN